MIHKRLISTVSHTRKYIAANVAVQWVSLWANIILLQNGYMVLGGIILWQGREENFSYCSFACHWGNFCAYGLFRAIQPYELSFLKISETGFA